MATVLGLKNSAIQGSLYLDYQMPGQMRKTFTDTYLVRASSTAEKDDDILSAGGIPLLRSLERNAYLIRKEAREVDAGALLWEVDCTYDSHIDKETPVLQINWEIEEKEEILRYDAVSYKPVVNSAKEPILATHPYPIPVATITRVESFFTAATILQYNGKVNNSPFYGAPAYCALMFGPTAQSRKLNGVQVWNVTYRVKFNFRLNPLTGQPQGWLLWLLDHGTRYVYETIEVDDVEVPLYKNFLDKQGDPTEGNLNGVGGPLDSLAPEVYLPFNRYALANFGALNLGG